MRSLSRAAARGTIAAVDPSTGGHSIPKIVTAGWAQSMSLTLPSLTSDTPSSTAASPRNCSGEYSSPFQVWVLSTSDCGVAAVVPEGCQHRDQRSERIGCGATKHSKVHFRLERLTKLAWLRPDIADLTPNG